MKHFVCCRSDKGPSGNQKAGKNSTSADVTSQWSSVPFDKQYGRVLLTSTLLEYKEMESNPSDQKSPEGNSERSAVY